MSCLYVCCNMGVRDGGSSFVLLSTQGISPKVSADLTLRKVYVWIVCLWVNLVPNFKVRFFLHSFPRDSCVFICPLQPAAPRWTCGHLLLAPSLSSLGGLQLKFSMLLWLLQPADSGGHLLSLLLLPSFRSPCSKTACPLRYLSGSTCSPAACFYS